MDKQLEDRINELGAIISKEKYVKRIKIDYESPGGSGHSSNDTVDIIKIPIYGYRYVNSKRERRRARRELEIIGLASSDVNIKNLVMEQSNAAKKLEYLPLKKIGRKIKSDFQYEPFFATFKWTMISCLSLLALDGVAIGIYKLIEYIKNN